MFPVYVAEKGASLPKEGTYYVVTRDKFYLHKDTGIVKALVEVDEIKMLGELSPYVELRLPKLPPDIIYKAWKFFNLVFDKYHSESAVVIHYNPENQTYYLHCPDQVVSHGSVNYDLDDRFENYQLVGTIHSHCDFSAFHSGIDVDDEVDQDGVHITLGHVNTKQFSASGCLVVNGTRFELELENAALGVRRVTMQDATRHPNIVPLNHQNRYMVSLSDEEIAQIDATYLADIREWVSQRVSTRGGGAFRNTAPKNNTNSQGTQQGTQQSLAKNEVAYTYRTDPSGKTAEKGWFNDAGERLNQETAAVAETDEWDAEAILRENDLLDDGNLFSEDQYNGEKSDITDDGLEDLTIVSQDELEASDLDAQADKIINPTDEELSQIEGKENG